MHTLNDFALQINTTEIKRRLGLQSESGEWQYIQELVEHASGLMQPRCVYKPCYIQEKGTETAIIEEVEFKSKVLRKNLDEVERVFPFVITLGRQLEDNISANEDFLEQYYLDTIANVALQDAIKALCSHLQDEYKLQKLSYMNPGSLQDWPIQQQKQLFSLLGDVQEEIGVRLAPSMLMYPSKSESGMFFPTEVTFFNCQLCPHENCPSRKAAFDRGLAGEYGVL